MSTRKRWVRIGLVSVFTVALTAGSYVAGTVAGAAVPFLYAAKFACVPDVGPASTYFIGGTGTQYRTVVNIHNPATTAQATIGKKAVIALTERVTDRPPPSNITTLKLGPDGALAIDCKDVKAILGGGAQPVGDGFVVILSDTRLDVYAAYTSRIMPAAAGASGIGGNIDVVRIDPLQNVP